MNSHLCVQQTVDFVRINKIKRLIPVHIGAFTAKEVLAFFREHHAEDKDEKN